jgi:uncharacterized protein YdcH (DUF465 family)
MYKNRIATLTETHRLLDKQIADAEKNSTYDKDKISEMKKQKLKYKDEISRLNKLQWEYEHEHLDYGDDR